LAATQRFFLGIDCGTSGARALAVTEKGTVATHASVSLGPDAVTKDGDRHEQRPGAWWSSVCKVTQDLLSQFDTSGVFAESLAGVSVDGTSGTVVCIDENGQALAPAIMYSDGRSAAEADEINAQAGDFCDKLGYRFGASFGLPKILWLQRNEPQTFERAAHCVHHADYILGRLCGDPAVSDYSNALKTGYDLIEERWPDWIDHFPGIRERLPRVVPPTTTVGQVTSEAAEATGLPEGLPVVAGVSDGTAGCLPSGVRKPGDTNTTLGTTLVFKRLADRICTHPDGLLYSHKLPGGYWLPGGASNTGGEWTETLFADQDLGTLDAEAKNRLPTSLLAYPLVRKGERFPFKSADAEGFCVPEADNETDRFAAYLQGTGLVERLCYEVLDGVAGQSTCEVFSTGGGSGSDVWMQCRSDATNRILHRPVCPESAFGSAILAAAGTFYSDIKEAIREMVQVERTFHPNGQHRARYDELYGRFCEELAGRGYR